MTAITASAARRELSSLIRRVNEGRGRVEIVSKYGNAVLISAAEYEELATTAHLFSTPANAARLREAIADAKAGRYTHRDLVTMRQAQMRGFRAEARRQTGRVLTEDEVRTLVGDAAHSAERSG